MPKPNSDQPSLDDLRLYCDVFRVVRDEPRRTFRSIAKERGQSTATILNCLTDLEQFFGVTFIERAQRQVHKHATVRGHEFYNEALAVLRAYDKLCAWKLVPETIVGTTNGALLYILPPIIESFLHDPSNGVTHPKPGAPTPERLPLRFVEGDYPALIRHVANGDVSFAIGPNVPQQDFAHVEIETLKKWEHRFMFICRPDSQYGKDIEARTRTSVKLSELASQPLLTLRAGLQPELDRRIPPPNFTSGGARIEMTTYAAILHCALMGVGAGIIPDVPDTLNQLRESGKLVFVPIEELGTIHIALYLPTGGREQLSGVPKNLADHIVDQIAKFHREV